MGKSLDKKPKRLSDSAIKAIACVAIIAAILLSLCALASVLCTEPPVLISGATLGLLVSHIIFTHNGNM